MAVCAAVTAATGAANVLLVAPEGTVTEAGAVTEALLLASATAKPPVGAAAVSATVQVSVPAPVKAKVVQEKVLRAAVAAGTRLMVAEAVRPASLAVTVARWLLVRLPVLAEKEAFVAPLATATELGTVRAERELESLTVVVAVAAGLTVTVQAAVLFGPRLVGVQARATVVRLEAAPAGQSAARPRTRAAEKFKNNLQNDKCDEARKEVGSVCIHVALPVPKAANPGAREESPTGLLVRGRIGPKAGAGQ